MSHLLIKTYRHGTIYNKPHFFILNKGMNSGKPLTAPCANCFVVLAETEAQKINLFWLVYGLWKAKAFHYYLKGSVIPFVSIKEISGFIINKWDKVLNAPSDFNKIVNNLRVLDDQEKQYKQALQLINQYRAALVIGYIRKTV